VSPLSLLTLFCLRMPAGVLAHLPAIPWDRAWRGIFRTCAAVAAGLLLVRLAFLPWARGPLLGPANFLTGAALVFSAAYAYAAAKGGGTAIRGVFLALSIAASTGAVADASRSALAAAVLAHPGRPPLVSWGRYALLPFDLLSCAILGSSLVTMLLGHFYLIAPSLPIRPLVRLSVVLLVEIHLRLLLCVGALLLARERFFPPAGASSLDFTVNLGVFVLPRILVGLVFPAAFSWLVYRTARIGSTQSATGILYVIVVFLIIGEMMNAGALAITGVPL